MNDRNPTRRTVLQAAALLPLVATAPGLVFAGKVARERRFLFLVAPGGWDPSLVFEAPARGDAIDRPAGTRAAHSGELSWASSPSRPGVDRFFERWGHRTAIVNGLHVPSQGHEAATRMLLTGDAAPGRVDWPTLLGRGAEPVAERAPRRSLDQALRRAADRLLAGRSRSERVRLPGLWDTHLDNTPQGAQFEELFVALDRLWTAMPGLLDQVVVVAASELGRTPRLNAGGGKDHWPFTSALVAGAGVAGGRVVGATDGGLVGRPVDLANGRPRAEGELLGCAHLGATLLALGGLSAHHHLPGTRPIDALLA